MKDAKGHGSDARGAHADGVDKVGRVPKVSASAMSLIKNTQPGGGFSVTPGGKVPTTGYMVAVPHRTTSVDPAALHTPGAQSIIQQHVQVNADVYKNPNVHIGGWHDPDTKKMSIDPAENVKDRATAIQMGIARNQKAIWDLKRGKTIETGGTGE